MTTSHASIAADASGTPVLFLRGGLTEDAENLLANGDWSVLAILGVEWPDYRCLAPFAHRIECLRVPFGPDSSLGLLDLRNLRILEATDALKPAVDFRMLDNLERLEALWDNKHPQYFANRNIRTLILHGIGGSDLSWMSAAKGLQVLELRGGRLSSLRGIGQASGLCELRVVGMKQCVDVQEVFALKGLRLLELDAPKAKLENLNWLASMPALKELMSSVQIGEVSWELLAKHPSLSSVGITTHEGYAATDDEIHSQLLASGRKLRAFARFSAKVPSFKIDFAN